MTPIASRLGAVLLVLVASTLLGAQTPYRASSDLVPVYATVTDRDGLLVQNLPKERFTIRDNGKVQPIALFSNDIQPLTIVVMLDRSGSMSEHIGVVNDAAGHFVRALLPADKARVGAFGGEIVIRPDGFSSDQDELLQELAALRVKGGSPVWASIDHSITALRSELGRRVVLVLTDGHNRPGAGVFTTLDDVIHRAQYNDIMAYTIGFAVRPQPGQGPGGFGPPFRRGGPPPQAKDSDKLEPPDPGLKKLAVATGGGYFELKESDGLAATFARVAEELHHQYLMAFMPARLDGEIHQLDVRISGGYTVRARKSYIADAKR